MMDEVDVFLFNGKCHGGRENKASEAVPSGSRILEAPHSPKKKIITAEPFYLQLAITF